MINLAIYYQLPNIAVTVAHHIISQLHLYISQI